ncbi:MAG TPA: hypothetical protein DIS98_11490 [Colwellia sp.]|nr:hypothetical protein [Colwellia sp.]
MPKYQTRFTSIDGKILYLYTKDMTTRGRLDTFKERYDVGISPALISRITNTLIEQVIEWQA